MSRLPMSLFPRLSLDRKQEVLGLLCLILGLLASLSLASSWGWVGEGLTGRAGRVVGGSLLNWMGWGAWGIPVLLLLWTAAFLRRRGFRGTLRRTGAMVMLEGLILGGLGLYAPARAGVVGGGLGLWLELVVGRWGGGIVLGGLFLIFLVVALELRPSALVDWFGVGARGIGLAVVRIGAAGVWLLGRGIRGLRQAFQALWRFAGVLVTLPGRVARRKAAQPLSTLEAVPATPSEEAAVEETTTPAKEAPSPPLAGETRPVRKPRPVRGAREYRLPSVDLLEPPPAQPGRARGDQEALGKVLMAKLHDFSTEGELVGISTGPVITRFEIRPAPGVKVGRFASLADDLALALKAYRVRILAPIPGKGVVGVEVPNPEPERVVLRELLEHPRWAESGQLPIPLGKDIVGEPLFADLARMPHLLIAGATGSGKSVFINAILTSFLLRFSPHELRLLVIDPKRLELMVYSGLPHLMGDVITDVRQVGRALKWVVGLMESRYELLARHGCRNIDEFNRRLAAGTLRGEPGGALEPLPYLLVVVDELADVMVINQLEVEEPLTRLAQMARAVGIHLVLATQRPSVDVLTGLIKANFPSRISFQVSSKVDSRTILDMNGAEQLVGRGDMLFLPAGRASPVRIQAPHVSRDETERVVQAHIEQAEEVVGEVPLAEPDLDLEEVGTGDRDSLFAEAARLVVRHDQGSTSMLQRRLQIGYTRAARIVDQLEAVGIVGPSEGSKAREVLVDKEMLDRILREVTGDG